MFYFLKKLLVPSLKNQPAFPSLKSKIFWPATTDFLLKFSSPILENGMQMPWHYHISWLPNK